ncbi:unnamed protein product [Aureobasidium vineae]|uniref:Uncharacterized protein n=1 Tax=Aureobasidium vineae TaxID=2773715 RepID=A0A9N8JD97_9PEZI|nr:unnamed protein product [Aureobasidium vineae]
MSHGFNELAGLREQILELLMYPTVTYTTEDIFEALLITHPDKGKKVLMKEFCPWNTPQPALRKMFEQTCKILASTSTTSTHVHSQAEPMAEVSNHTISGLRAQIINNVNFLYPTRSLFIITLLSSTGDQWSAKAVDGDNVIAAVDVTSPPSTPVQDPAVLAESSTYTTAILVADNGLLSGLPFPTFLPSSVKTSPYISAASVAVLQDRPNALAGFGSCFRLLE